MDDGEMGQWHCTNRDCASPETRSLPRETAGPPMCGCGSRMQRVTCTAFVRYLNFLRDDEHRPGDCTARKGVMGDGNFENGFYRSK